MGDRIKVAQNEFFCADMLVVESSDAVEALCYVETKNLDGETNLKPKKVVKKLIGVSEEGSEIAVVNYELPNNLIYKFEGNVTCGDQ